MLRKSWYWSNKKKFLRSKQLLLKHHISAQNEGKHILATSIFQNFPPSRVTPAASQTMATLSEISLFANKSTWELWSSYGRFFTSPFISFIILSFKHWTCRQINTVYKQCLLVTGCNLPDNNVTTQGERSPLGTFHRTLHCDTNMRQITCSHFYCQVSLHAPQRDTTTNRRTSPRQRNATSENVRSYKSFVLLTTSLPSTILFSNICDKCSATKWHLIKILSFIVPQCSACWL